MQISQTQSNGVTVAALNGRLDSGTATAAEKQLLDMVAAGATRLTLDCSALEYVSSAGLRVFLSAAKRMKQAQGKLALANLSNQVQQIFDIAGFESILPVFKTVNEAVDASAI